MELLNGLMEKWEGEFYFPSDRKWKKGIWKEGKRVKWIQNSDDYF